MIDTTLAGRALAKLPPLIPVDAAEDDPRRDAGLGLLVVAAFFVAFLGWACFTRLDAAAFAAGEVSVAGHRQTVQHKEGGTVGAILVKEGQHVSAGQVLVRMASPDVEAAAQSVSSEVIGLQAQQARLRAEEAGSSTIAWPTEFASLTGADRVAADEAMKAQQTELHARAATLDAKRQVLKQRSVELNQQVAGYRSQVNASARQQQLIEDELAGVKTLAAKGYAPLTRVRALERNQAELAGQKGQYSANIAQTVQQAGEARLQVLQVEKEQQEDVAKQLRDVAFQLDELKPKLNAARDTLDRVQVRAPASGVVMGLTVFTPGGVVSPGARLMDIVPDRAPLVVEAAVSPESVDNLHMGQVAEVKFPSIHARGLPILKGKVTRVSADSMVNERTGARYYSMEVTVPVSELNLLQKAVGDAAVRPGMPAQVVVPLRKRSALDYLLSPLTEALFGSFRER
jgi:HlyD family secretion protein